MIVFFEKKFLDFWCICPGFQCHAVSFAVHGSSLISCRQEWQPSHLIRILAHFITRNNHPFSWVTIKSALIHNAIHRHSNNVWHIKVHSLTGKQYLTIIASNGTSISTVWKLWLHLLHYALTFCFIFTWHVDIVITDYFLSVTGPLLESCIRIPHSPLAIEQPQLNRLGPFGIHACLDLSQERVWFLFAHQAHSKEPPAC